VAIDPVIVPPTDMQKVLLTHDTEVSLTQPDCGARATLLHDEPSQRLLSAEAGGVALVPWIGPTFIQNDPLVQDKDSHSGD
jgi:hypothetical protein